MKKFFIILNVVYFVVFWVGVGLVSIDETIRIGDAYAMYMGIGVLVNIFGAMFYSIHEG